MTNSSVLQDRGKKVDMDEPVFGGKDTSKDTSIYIGCLGKTNIRLGDSN